MQRLRPFSYFEPSTLKEGFEILAAKAGSALPLAGGTDLLVRMKNGQVRPSALVNLKGIPGLGEIAKEPGRELKIGALARIAALEQSPEVLADYPLLAEAAAVLGSPSIRNLATLGGNIGRASPASDMVPSLIVLGARVLAQGAGGKRDVEMESFFAGPGATALSPGEIIMAVALPPPAPRSAGAYVKLGRREGMECALVGAAAWLALADKDGEAREARIALAAVAPVPLRARRAEEALLSGTLTESRLREAAAAAAEEASPITDMRASASYRREMVKVLTFRALETALQRARGRRD